MRTIFKIIAAPFIVVLTILVSVLSFLFDYAAAALNIVAGLLVVLGVVALFTDTVFNACVVLFLGFLISPYGLPAIWERIIGLLYDLNYSLKNFITS